MLRVQLEKLRMFLGVAEPPEEDLACVEEVRMAGTCEWLFAKDTYRAWANFTLNTPSILWVKGQPAAGKSVLAGYAINQLQKSDASCSYFFFKHSDKSKSRLAACLRSLAFQMACTNDHARKKLLGIQKEDTKFDKDDERIVWRKLFSAGIFETQFSRHYWVIDGLDECENHSKFFDPMLARLNEATPLRILITSRETPELQKHLMNIGLDRFHFVMISAVDTLPDIKLFAETKAKSLVVLEGNKRASLVEKIMAKSKGSFLWTNLVMNELASCYSEEAIRQVLDEVPRDMEPLYQRILQAMSQATRGKRLANAILTWATCATRPLRTNELVGALRIDVGENLLDMEMTITALCGQLVTVDRYGKIQMVHETAREFLLLEGLESEFAIKAKESHTQMARVCLTYLTGFEMKPPLGKKRGPAASGSKKRTEFSRYACEAFSYHLCRAEPFRNDIMILLDKFFEANVQSWIEAIAQTQDLTLLIRTARNLREYSDLHYADPPIPQTEMRTIKGWATDLVRIAAKFAGPLIASPSAIYSLIPPFCPSESMVHGMAHSRRRLVVVGLVNTQWDDRLACIDIPEGRTIAVCFGDEFFAVAFTAGKLALYDAASCQELKVLNHGERIRFLEFKSRSTVLASCGMKTIKIWDARSGDTIHSFSAPPTTNLSHF